MKKGDRVYVAVSENGALRLLVRGLIYKKTTHAEDSVEVTVTKVFYSDKTPGFPRTRDLRTFGKEYVHPWPDGIPGVIRHIFGTAK
jgi:hypothetical protein